MNVIDDKYKIAEMKSKYTRQQMLDIIEDDESDSIDNDFYNGANLSETLLDIYMNGCDGWNTATEEQLCWRVFEILEKREEKENEK